MKKLTNKPAMINTPPANNHHVSPMILRYKAHVRHDLVFMAIVVIAVAIFLLILFK